MDIYHICMLNTQSVTAGDAGCMHAHLTISLLVPRCPYGQLLCRCGNIVIAIHTASIGLILHVHTWNRSLELFKQYIQKSVVACTYHSLKL